MDTRKLEYRKGHEPHNQALIYDEGTSVDVAVTYSDKDGITAAELTRRWNAYPEAELRIRELVNACEELLRHANGIRGEWMDPLGTAECVMNEGMAFLDTLKTN